MYLFNSSSVFPVKGLAKHPTKFADDFDLRAARTPIIPPAAPTAAATNPTATSAIALCAGYTHQCFLAATTEVTVVLVVI